MPAGIYSFLNSEFCTSLKKVLIVDCFRKISFGGYICEIYYVHAYISCMIYCVITRDDSSWRVVFLLTLSMSMHV